MSENELKTRILDGLDEILGVAMNKFKNPRIKDRNKQSWARLFILASREYANLRTIEQNENIEKRLDKIEEVLFKNE